MVDDVTRHRDLANAINGMGAHGSVGQPQRKQSWDELTADERIERLREVVRSKDMAIQDLRSQLSSLAAALTSHRHGENHELLVPYYGHAGGALVQGRLYDPLA